MAQDRSCSSADPVSLAPGTMGFRRSEGASYFTLSTLRSRRISLKLHHTPCYDFACEHFKLRLAQAAEMLQFSRVGLACANAAT